MTNGLLHVMKKPLLANVPLRKFVWNRQIYKILKNMCTDFNTGSSKFREHNQEKSAEIHDQQQIASWHAGGGIVSCNAYNCLV